MSSKSQLHPQMLHGRCLPQDWRHHHLSIHSLRADGCARSGSPGVQKRWSGRDIWERSTAGPLSPQCRWQVPMTGAAIDRHRSFRGAGFGGTMSDCQAEVWIPVADPAGWNLQEAAWDDGSSVTQWQKILSSCFGPISYRTFAAIIPGNIKVIVSFVQR